MRGALLPGRRLVHGAVSSRCTSRSTPLQPTARLTRPSSSSSSASASASASMVRNSRWLSDVQSRLGACIKFGLRTPAELDTCRRISALLGSSWKGLVAGAEGFCVEPAEAHAPHPIWSQKVLWGEMDSMGHVNNAMYLRYSETSRIWFFKRLNRLVPREHRAAWETILRPVGIGLILKTIKVDFLLPLQYPDTISLVHSLAAPPHAGEIFLRCWILSHNHQRVAARIEENVPLYDYARGKKAALPRWMEDLLTQTREHEQASRDYWTSVRQNVEAWLKGLEDSTVHSGKEELVGGATPVMPASAATSQVLDGAEPSTAERLQPHQPAAAKQGPEIPRSDSSTLGAQGSRAKPTWGIKK